MSGGGDNNGDSGVVAELNIDELEEFLYMVWAWATSEIWVLPLLLICSLSGFMFFGTIDCIVVINEQSVVLGIGDTPLHCIYNCSEAVLVLWISDGLIREYLCGELEVDFTMLVLT